MSLVDYTASDDEATDEDVREKQENDAIKEPQNHDPQPPPPPQNLEAAWSSNQLPETSAPLTVPSIELPDASLLLNSPSVSSIVFSGSDHSSRVAAAMAENASRKRDSNGQTSSLTRNKLPRGNLHHSKNIPDTVGGLLVPPQLSGRSVVINAECWYMRHPPIYTRNVYVAVSNIVTEDVSKLFVRKHAEPSSSSH